MEKFYQAFGWGNGGDSSIPAKVASPVFCLSSSESSHKIIIYWQARYLHPKL